MSPGLVVTLCRVDYILTSTIVNVGNCSRSAEGKDDMSRVKRGKAQVTVDESWIMLLLTGAFIVDRVHHPIACFNQIPRNYCSFSISDNIHQRRPS